MIFFEVTPKYAAWLAKYANGRCIIDVGCGEGQLIRAVRAAGYNKIMGIDMMFDPLDPNNRDIANAVMPMDVTTSKILKHPDYLYVMARPCHGGFTELVAHGMSWEKQELLYVGLDNNLEQDMGDALKPKKLRTPKCPGGEKTYSVTVTGSLSGFDPEAKFRKTLARLGLRP